MRNNVGWMKLKLRQSDIDAIKLDKRPIIALVERVGLFYLNQILLQHSLQLTAPGYLGVALVTKFERPEWRNLIIIQTDSSTLQTGEPPFITSHPISMVTWLVRDQSYLSRMLYIQKYPLAVFNLIYSMLSNIEAPIFMFLEWQFTMCLKIFEPSLNFVEKIILCLPHHD